MLFMLEFAGAKITLLVNAQDVDQTKLPEGVTKVEEMPETLATNRHIQKLSMISSKNGWVFISTLDLE